jgi:hypothetical protein
MGEGVGGIINGSGNTPFKKMGMDNFGFLAKIKNEICSGGVAKIIGEQRSRHCALVIENFHSLVRIKDTDDIVESAYRVKDLSTIDVIEQRSEKALNSLYELLDPAEKMRIGSPQQYLIALQRLLYEYSHLNIKERQMLDYAVYLHDYGYVKENSWDHGMIGSAMLHTFFRNLGIPTQASEIIPGSVKNPAVYARKQEELFMNVKNLVAYHGLFCNFGADIFPDSIEMVRAINPRLLRMLFILDCLDCSGKVIKNDDGTFTGRNMLGIRLLTEMQDILDREDLFLHDQSWFYKYRLEHLLGPNTYVHINEQEYGMLEGKLNERFKPNELDFFKTLLARHLEDRAFPVFQELFINRKSLNATVELLYAITKRCGEIGLKGSDKVLFVTNPDIVYAIPWKSPKREKAILNLKTSFTEGKFNDRTDLILDDYCGKKRLTLNLKV